MSDIHVITAAKIFGVPAFSGTKVQRDSARNINYALMYANPPKAAQ